MEIEDSSCHCEYDLNYFLLCKKNYVKIIERINAILENFENIKILTMNGVCQDDIDFFIEKRCEIYVLMWKSGCRPATNAEVKMWKLLNKIWSEN
jgi:hypothetical protein